MYSNQTAFQEGRAGRQNVFLNPTILGVETLFSANFLRFGPSQLHGNMFLPSFFFSFESLQFTKTKKKSDLKTCATSGKKNAEIGHFSILGEKLFIKTVLLQVVDLVDLTKKTLIHLIVIRECLEIISSLFSLASLS